MSMVKVETEIEQVPCENETQGSHIEEGVQQTGIREKEGVSGPNPWVFLILAILALFFQVVFGVLGLGN